MPSNWHERYALQSKWTKNIRDYLLKDIPLSEDSVILEMGCGTGVIISDLANSKNCLSVGIDQDFSSLNMTTRFFINISRICADANYTPLKHNSFDVVFCHFFLMWLPQPKKVLFEILRLLKPGGHFFISAEPDYYSRVDYPAPLDQLGAIQTQALARQAADIGIGPKLPSLLLQTGFNLMKYGSIGYEKPVPGLPLWWESEWNMISHDLATIDSTHDLTPYMEIDRQSWLNGKRILYVPTYYAVASKPQQ